MVNVQQQSAEPVRGHVDGRRNQGRKAEGVSKRRHQSLNEDFEAAPQKFVIKCRWCKLPGIIGGPNHEECPQVEEWSKAQKRPPP